MLSVRSSVKERVWIWALGAVGELRVAEKMLLASLAYFGLACLWFPLPGTQRLAVLVLMLLAATLVVLLARSSMKEQRRLAATVRDWFPCLAILLVYRVSGLFFVPDPTHRLDYLFQRWDAALLNHHWILKALSATAPALQYYLELAYLLCYPLVPLGLGCLYVARPWEGFVERASFARKRIVDRFWSAVFPAAVICYIVFPMTPLTPPRVLFGDVPGPAVEPLLRRWNFWILDRYSVQACVFPSAHVAATTATALVIRAYLPRVGVLFGIAALSIAASTVYGRYHYTADAIAGALVGLATYGLSSWINRDGRPLRKTGP